MSEEIVPQDEQEVKRKCEVEWCAEDAWREGLCWYHFLAEVIDEWDAEEPEEVDFIFGDHTMNTSWYGYELEEVLA